ncbi:protein pitchfork-like isoform X2 [Centropristis striata]|uniref:protein pitchfork-like isoform X2 n=1 Tax=Centropristis striata TaxID=184440 RepID=UPI0027E1F4BF|nr:protein pitchfork-like isoform X2 [Centropristis striata]
MSDPHQRLHFGSCQERRLFPLYYAPDWLGNQLRRQEAPHLGPGCYDSHEFGTIIYDLEKTPGSKKGYGLSARTATRFPPCSKTATPSPQQYQQDQSWSRVPAPGKTPFSSTTHRFQSMSCAAEDSPGDKQESELANVLWEARLVQTTAAGEEVTQGEAQQ